LRTRFAQCFYLAQAQFSAHGFDFDDFKYKPSAAFVLQSEQPTMRKPLCWARAQAA